MSDDNDPILKEAQAAAAADFDRKMLEFAATPTLCTRFSLLPFDTNQGVLVLGGSLVGKKVDGSAEGVGRPIAAFLFAKNVAEDLVIHLRSRFSITDADLENAKERNPGM